jgi:hypothetical protein
LVQGGVTLAGSGQGGTDPRSLGQDVVDRLRQLLELASTAIAEADEHPRLGAKRRVWGGYESNLRSAWADAREALETIARAGGDYAASLFDELATPMPEDAGAHFFETKTRRLAECRDILSRYSPRGE